jgi:hypothetical protein
MNLHIANTIEKAIKIPFKQYEQHKVEQIVNEQINRLFGGTDGDYFVMNIVTRRNMQGKEFKIVLVEDRDQIKHQVYFELVPMEKATQIR